jgi:hypothetical protein
MSLMRAGKFVKLTRNTPLERIWPMLDQRRHQRIRFSVPQKISIGYGGDWRGRYRKPLLSGLMMRTPMPLEISRNVGCEFSVFSRR